MAIQVNIGEAKTRLSELVAASLRGETVVLARGNVPAVTLVPTEEMAAKARTASAARRAAAFGKYRDAFAGADLSIEALKAHRTDLDDGDDPLLP